MSQQKLAGSSHGQEGTLLKNSFGLLEKLRSQVNQGDTEKVFGDNQG